MVLVGRLSADTHWKPRIAHRVSLVWRCWLWWYRTFASSQWNDVWLSVSDATLGSRGIHHREHLQYGQFHRCRLSISVSASVVNLIQLKLMESKSRTVKFGFEIVLSLLIDRATTNRETITHSLFLKLHCGCPSQPRSQAEWTRCIGHRGSLVSGQSRLNSEP